MAKKLNTDVFIYRSKLLHDDKYDYSKSKYVNNRTKITIICKKHGELLVWPSAFLQGHGCSKCAHTKFFDNDSFIKQAQKIHKFKYDYTYIKYENHNKKIKILCQKHGIFEQRPNIHLRGHGCPICGKESRESIKKEKEVKPNLKYTKENIFDLLSIVHNNNYTYNKNSFKSMDKKIEIYCSKHGSFYQTCYSHLRGHGCPICKESAGELLISKLLNEKGIDFFRQYRFPDCRNKLPLPFDFYLPELKICIEYDGKQHFKKDSIYFSSKLILNDEIKNLYCKNNKIKIIRIPYWDFKKISSILDIEVN